MPTATTPPRWDLTPIFPSLDSPEFKNAFEAFRGEIGALERLFDDKGVRGQERPSGDSQGVLDEALSAYNAVLESGRLLGSYLYLLVTTDSADEAAQARQSELQIELSRLGKLGTRFTAWIGCLDVEGLIEESGPAREHAFSLRKAKIASMRLMSPPEETLASDLRLSGGVAWSKLHGNITSMLEVAVRAGEGERRMPMSMVRNLAYEADRDLRRAGYEAEMEGWKTVEVPLAACLNGIKGERATLCRRRGWESALDEALFDANIDRPTLDAMMEAAWESFPDFRRYLRSKAAMLGLQKLAWYDLFAPVGSEGAGWEYEAGAEFVARHFDGYSQRLGDFARRTFRERWIDAEPRTGKRDGAYCSGVRRDESRVMMNFKPAFGAVSTLAHELGHAYHNLCLAERTSLQRSTPMTLAETASIFCETIIKRAALEEGSEAERVSILEASLQGACQVVVDITSRFLFEQAVFDGRSQRELSPAELSQAMLEAQRKTYGNGLDEELLHPYMWAVKPHYYSAGSSFYNFPYMFGLLFALGLYAQYAQEPSGFHARYDELLSSTGLADASTLADGFGIDIRKPDFWRASLDQVRLDVDRFEQLAGPTRA